MKAIKYLFFLIIVLGVGSLKAQTVYVETFSGITDGATSDVGTYGWNTDTSPGSPTTFSKQSQASLDFFQGQNTGGPVKWYSDVIDISGYPGGVTISYDIAETGNLQASEYIGIYYNTDGGQGADNTINETFNDFGSTFIPITSGTITGSNIQIVIIIDNNSDFRSHYFRNVTVKALSGSTLYSTGSGDWTDPGNWSTIGYGGASCSCSPDESTVVNIGNSNTIDVSSEIYSEDLTIDATGILRYTKDNAYIWMADNADFVLNGGTLDKNGFLAYLIFQGSSGSSTLTVNSGTFDIDYIYHIGTHNLELLGAGSLTATYLILGNTGTITNNATGTIASGIYYITSGSTLVNNGTISGGGDIYFDNDNQTLTNNGTISVTSGLFSGTGDNGNLVTNSSGATLTIGGDISLTNGNMTINNSGTINHAGTFTNIDNGSDFFNLDGGVWNWSLAPNTGYDTSVDANLDCTNGSNTFNYNGAGNQVIINTAYSNLSLSNSGTKTSQGNLDISGNLSISGTAQLDVDSGNDNITLSGNWTNTSANADTFLEGQETVTLNGTTDQTITYAGGETFYDLTINKASGQVNLATGSDVSVSNVLDLTSGNIDIADQNLTITSTGSISNGGSSSFVITSGSGQLTQNNLGLLGRIGSIVFPIGRISSAYTPLTIDNSLGIADNYSVRVCSNTYQEGGCETGILKSDGVVDRTWFINEAVAGGSNADLTFQWNGANELGSFNRANLNIVHYNGTDWVSLVNTSAAGANPYTASVSGVTGFSPFAIEDATSTPLPVELLDFNAKFNSSIVSLDWETASEINNDYFIVERTLDFENFEQVAIIQGNGTTTEKTRYQLEDHAPFGGISYYRLTQVDFDGTSKSFAPAMVNVPQSASIKAYIYPNPSDGKTINIRLTGFDKIQMVSLNLTDLNGKVVHEEQVRLDNTEAFYGQINFSKTIPSGIYLLHINTPTPITKKIIVK
ncbi:MAG: T9SS type A sorting domain-containing protein [Cyclobacteriaceae bacterium]|nr:T9SS type A sorting domain-containing protein [Cyclobacteriaceae bacterium]